MSLRRTALLGPVLALTLVAGCEPSASAPAPEAVSEKQALTGFDFANGNIAGEYIIPLVVPTVLQSIRGGDASIVLITTATTITSWFDAIAPYSTTMQGVYSRIPRRPASESLDNTNRNVAILYASLRALSAVQPRYVSTWRQMLVTVGLNPDDNSTDLTTAVGIGNVAGNTVVAARKHDGMNRDGDAGGRKYNLEPYADTTGYEPVNTHLELIDPSRWQPARNNTGTGLFKVQTFVTPQYGKTRPFSLTRRQIKGLESPRPQNSDWKRNRAAYKAQADEVLAASAGLTDLQKMTTELFDNKFASLGRGGDFLARSRGFTLEQFVQYDFVVQVAAFDAGIATWKQKIRYDAVRPFSAIRQLYGKKKLTAWGGVGKGTVNDITGNEWTSYLPVADHPEYPSGSACFCAAHAQASRRFVGTDAFGWTVPRARGTSVIEPGITPAADIVMSFPTFTDFERDCASSRVWSGVHFRAAVDEGLRLCKPVGDMTYEFAMKHITGNVGPLEPISNREYDEDDDDDDDDDRGRGRGRGRDHDD